MRLLIGSRLFVHGTRFFSYSNISDTYPDSCISILKAFLIYKISILLIILAKKILLIKQRWHRQGNQQHHMGYLPFQFVRIQILPRKFPSCS